MRRSRLIQPVVAYRWLFDGQQPLDVSADDFWPGRVITEHRCIIDFDKIPVWRDDGSSWRPVLPDYEVLECGHERPVDFTKDGHQMYMRARRRCVLCAVDRLR